MVHHLVLFKLKDETTDEQERELVARLEAMKGRVPGMVDLAAGLNVTPEVEKKKGFSVGLLVQFETMQHLIDYGPHPVHEEARRYIRTVVDDVIVMDFES